MTITASGGTDAANIVLFWPDNLPDGADAQLAKDPIDLIESLRDEGKLIWFPCDGDGGYTVRIFVREEIPGELRMHCHDEELIPKLIVRGVGYFGGMEYMFKFDNRELKRYPSMCQAVDIPEATYSARIYRTEIPDELYDAWLVNRVGTRAKRLWDLHQVFAAASVVSVVVTVVAALALTLTTWLCALAVTGPVVLCTVLMSHTDRYKRVPIARDLFEQMYPSYVVHLE